MKDLSLPGGSLFAAPISEQIWGMKYQLKNHDGTILDRDVTDTWKRVADALSQAEEYPSDWAEMFYQSLEDFKFLPAGRITAGAGTDRSVTLFNCFVMGTVPDDMGGIFDMLKEAALTMQQGGGIGYDFSTLRPKGAEVKGVSADASGPLTFMDVWDSMCKTIMSAGSRRGAMMATIRCDHPDVLDFITAKQDSTRLRNFNLSVLITDGFMAAVEAGGDWDLKFEGKIYSTIRAQELWDKIMQSTYDYAEPGVIFIDRINNTNNLRAIETIAATNPCVPAGTPILTRDGWQEIDTLVGEKIEVWNGFEWSFTEPRITGHDQPMVTVSLSNGRSLTCTTAHRFVLKDGTKVAAEDLPEGAQLMKHDWPIINGGSDFEIAYQQGFFSGDGWIGRPGEHYIGLYGEKRELVDAFEGDAKTYPISGGYEGTDLTQTRIYVRFDGQNYHPKTFVPDSSWSVQSRLDWLSGLMDSDGCIYRSDNSVSSQISSKDRSFLEDVQLMLNTLGVSGYLAPMKDCWRLTISANSVRDLSDLGLATKRLDFHSNDPQRDASRFVQVVSVEYRKVREDTVYCFTETERHLGCFDGVLTGQCGEQPLPPYGACLLGSINLARLVRHPFTEEAYLDVEGLEETVKVAVRMLDNVVDVSNFPLEAQRVEALNKRRLGLGQTGVADALAMLRIAYGTDAAAAWVENVSRLIDNQAYQASALLAKEKGSYPLFNVDEVLAAGTHASELFPETQTLIRRYGLRNSHLTSIAPTGTISLYAGNVSSGIEPIFAFEYERKVTHRDGTKTTEKVQDYAVNKYREIYGDVDLPDYFVSAQTLAPLDHVKMQAAAQAGVDSSISKTINVPEDISFDDFKEVYMEAFHTNCKGCTTYRPNDVTGSVLSVTPEKPETDDLAPRAEILDGKTYKLKWPELAHAFYVTINDDVDGVPFEIFITTQNVEAQPWIAALSRMISAVFRRKGNLTFVAEELQEIYDPRGGAWVGGRYVRSLIAAIGQIIEEHSGERKKTSSAEGQVCGQCGEVAVKMEAGCETCSSCGHSRCG